MCWPHSVTHVLASCPPRPSPPGRGRILRRLPRVRERQFHRTWLSALAAKAPTEKNPNRTLLEKHLGDYTARNSFDYFIHKDIGGFLRRELDFYIKNEIMHKIGRASCR